MNEIKPAPEMSMIHNERGCSWGGKNSEETPEEISWKQELTLFQLTGISVK